MTTNRDTATSGSRRLSWGLVVVAGWALVIVISREWSDHLPVAALHLGTVAPLFGFRRVHFLTTSLLPAAAFAGLVAIAGPRVASRVQWGLLLLIAWLSSAAWAVLLAASDGWAQVSRPLTRYDEYLPAVHRVGSIHLFLRQFAAHISSYPTHVKGHGPLALLAFVGLARLGLPQPAVAAAMVIALGTSAVAAAAITIRLVADEAAARRALPFLVLTPAVVWIATTGDAMFLGVSAWGVALLAIAASRSGAAAGALALCSGLLFGAMIYMSYGLLVFATIPLAVAALRRRPAVLAIAAVGVALVVATFSVEGFSYIAGFDATRRAWAAGVGPHRSRPYFAVADFAELAFAVGPVAAFGLGYLRHRRMLILVGAVVVALLASDASGFVRGEAERIWLPFTPWIIAALGDLEVTERRKTVLLVVQAALAIGVQAVVLSPW